jgi:hypothetical protein
MAEEMPPMPKRAPTLTPTFADRYGAGGKAPARSGRRFATEPHIDSPDADFVMPQPDRVRVPNQNYQVISCVAPEGTRVKCKNVAIKFSPCFNTLEEANRHAEAVRNEDPRFDVDVIEMYNWVTVPKSEEIKPFIRKEYTDKFLTNVLKGQQQALAQSRKEMDDRVARDRAKAEADLRKKYGPDYVMQKRPDAVNEYEAKKQEHDAATDGMKFSQRELVEMLARFIVSTKKIKPDAAGEFMKFIEASGIARDAPPGEGDICVVVPDAGQQPAPPPPEEQ